LCLKPVIILKWLAVVGIHNMSIFSLHVGVMLSWLEFQHLLLLYFFISFCRKKIFWGYIISIRNIASYT